MKSAAKLNAFTLRGYRQHSSISVPSHRPILALLGLTLSLGAAASTTTGNATNGATLWTNDGCTACHGSSPSGNRFNAANASTVIDYAIANNYGGQMGTRSGVSAADRNDLAAYIATFVPDPSPSNAPVPYNTAAQFNISTFSFGTGTFTGLALVSAPSKGTVTFNGSTATYTPNNGQSGADSFTYNAIGPAGTSNVRTATVLIAAPAATPVCSISAAPSSIAAGASSVLTASCTPFASTYAWTGGTCAGTTGSSCTVSPTVTTTYSVRGTNGGGQGNAGSATVTVTNGVVGQLHNIPSPGNSDGAFLRFVNMGSAAIPVSGTLYDQNGIQMGAANVALTPGLPGKGVLVLAGSDIATLFGITGWTGRAMLEVRSSVNSSTLLMQDLVRSTTLTNMSCVSDRFAVNVPATGNTDQAFVRIYNVGSTAGAVRGTLYDQNGVVLGTPNSVLVGALGAKAVSALTADTILSATGATPWSGRAWLDMTADFGANLKIMNLIRDPSNTLNDMSCAFTLGTVGQLYNIPSPGNSDSAFLRFYNSGLTAGSVTGTLYDQNGVVLGTQNTVLTSSLPGHGVLVLASTDIASKFGVSTWSGRAWMEVTSTLPAGVLVMQNLVRSTTLTNMSCVSDRIAVNIPASGNTDQAFIRLYNIGSTAGAVRGTLYDQNGNVLGNANSVIVASLSGKAVAALTADTIQGATGASLWTGRAWLDLTADFGANLKIMNLIRDPSNTLNDMSCAF